ncbi:MAG: Rne/Rng family ribonuclease [Saprospiraceae bacterium]|jgi:ribonuclease G|nr:Rne/Rng family ribonuclease [Saprospiraceae bacterium]MBK6477571.1 Rne/Rng family ribonuclease [Saprospiraceae bacterium]MBK6816556.1 Rne/Rng family ribonuclease [Saprospiraceae bacterium]MBK7371081.1 Rne/Rng family ribonuclease [Saprospiraceae bacterium]MBK8281153.1 Rne/Rng family ribonuclease [Saprospiraceae bacterium]
MERELIINSTPKDVEIALLENGKLVELHHQVSDENFQVGDVFLGSVTKLMPGLNAAFVDIGHSKDAFLHYTDLGPGLNSFLSFTEKSIQGKLTSHMLDQFMVEPEINKHGKVNQVLAKKQNILVQILKEPISTKGPRLSGEITIPGRFMVLTPFTDQVAVSKKIEDQDERKRLQILVESIKPKNFGVIVRTAAAGKKVADLHEEITELTEKWDTIHKQLYKGRAPLKLLSELDKTSSMLRDLLNASFNKIVTNDRDLYQSIKSLLQSIAPEQTKIVQYFKGDKPIMDQLGVSRQIKSSFGKTATMPSGAYLVIDHTEAMHVIDVNSGPKMQKTDQQSAALSVNLEAAMEIARQLRLRDIGGLIIIDFIDMKSQEHKNHLYKMMKDFMAPDRAQHSILPLSKFGLMQITRERVKPAVNININETCPSCGGTGHIRPSILVTDEIERDLDFLIKHRTDTRFTVELHPFLASYFTKGLWSKQWQLWWKYKRWINIRVNENIALTDFKLFDSNQDEIRMN